MRSTKQEGNGKFTAGLIIREQKSVQNLKGDLGSFLISK